MTRLALVFILVVIVAGFVFGIQAANEGHFTYTLDDAYIHLALAENINRGVYGVNFHEISAPSSSIIWALLLALGGAGVFVPLVLSVAAAAGALLVFHEITRLALPTMPRVQFVMTLAYGFFINLLGMIFFGMEHVLQAFVGVLLIYGLLRAHLDGKLSFVLVALVLNPLVRYENLAFAVPVALYLVWRYRAWYAPLLVVALPAIFSLVLKAHDLGWLPSSVLAKASINPLENILLHAQEPIGLWSVMLFGLLVIALSKRRDVPLTCVGLGAVTLFLLFGGQGRYAWVSPAALLPLVMYIWRGAVRWWLSHPILVVAFCLLGLPFVLVPAALAGGIVPSAHNIYQQQYQMHRFISEYWQAPVAVNDLGYVSYQNDVYVLDLWGLASYEALTLRKNEPDSSWIPALMDAKQVDIAMLYRSWFPDIDAYLVPVATMKLGGEQWSVADPVVSFYARDAATAETLRGALEAFAAELPPALGVIAFTND